MSMNVLERIVADKRIEVEAQKAERPLAELVAQATLSTRDFLGALSESQTSFILECKKASPSKGLIREDFDLDLITSVYGKYATCISVLTDGKYFQGNHDYLKYVSERVSQPLIGKDFYVDEYQVYLARCYGADAILLMLSVLNDDEYKALAKVARSLNMSILTEVSNVEETERAIELGAKIIGINNRNLRDLSTDIARTEELVPMIPEDRLVISESGIYTHQQVRRLSPISDGFLVGSSLMAEDDIDAACQRLIIGEHKVCGLTRPQDAIAAKQAGAVYGGLIFAEKSPRCVSLEQAQGVIEAVASAPLLFIGVFVNADNQAIADTAKSLNLHAVQLHGNESDADIDDLRTKLDADCQIWKAVPVSAALPVLPANADRILLDSKHDGQFGGTGQSFNWQLIAEHPQREKFILAGGINNDSIRAAAAVNVGNLDINSGVETAPGIKDAELLNNLFTQLRDY